MPTRTDGKSNSRDIVPEPPKTFAPQVRDGTKGKAWDSLRDLSRRSVKVDADMLFTLARSNLRARRMRMRHLPEAMFGEPAWDMLLDLYVSARSDARHTVSSVSAASGAPSTTALRWIDYLEREGLIQRRSNPTDKRVAFIELTAKGGKLIESYLAGLIKENVIPTIGG